jgi:hypothetical protein
VIKIHFIACRICLLPTRNRRDRAVVPSSRRGKSGLFVRVQFGDAGRGSSIVAPQAAQSTTFWQLSPQSSGPIDSADHSKNLWEPPICHLTELSCSFCWSREHSKIQPVGTRAPYRRRTPQPIRCFLQNLTLTGVRERIAKKSGDRRLHSVFRGRLGECAAGGLPLGDLAALAAHGRPFVACNVRCARLRRLTQGEASVDGCVTRFAFGGD